MYRDRESTELGFRGPPGILGPYGRQVHQQLPGEPLPNGQVTRILIEVFVLVGIGVQVVELAPRLATSSAGHVTREVGYELPVVGAPHVGGGLLDLLVAAPV